MQLFQKLISRYKLQVLLAMLCVALEALCDLLGPTLMARIINEGVENGDLSAVTYWGLRMLLVTLFGAGFAISRNVLASRVSQRVGADLRYDLFEKIMRFSEASVDKIETGSLITRMTNDTAQLMGFVNGIMRIFLKAPITCIGSIALATALNPRLSVIILIVVVVAALCIFLSMKYSYPRFDRLQMATDRLNSLAQEYLGGIRLVKAFGTYDEELMRFDKANTELREKGISSQRIITFAAPIITFTVGLGTASAIFFGSRLFTQGQIQPGNISAFTIYMAQMLGSLLMITNIFNTFVRTKASTARVMDVLASEDDFPLTGEVLALDRGVAFDSVSFTYPGGSGIPAIRDVSFEVLAGESLAIIGPTGSGKSTLCWLLLRLYDADSGRIAIGGQDIRHLPLDTVRHQVAIVPQTAMLFTGTIAENIRWGDPDAMDEQVEQVAEMAQAADFIQNIPEAYQSLLHGGAINLSGGQRQRVSIARGLIKRASVLILDDATSALDSITEAKVRGALESIKDQKTVITVTQRCTTAMFSDKILVMEDGRGVGFGTHRELLKTCQTYQEIYRSQVDLREEAR